MRRAGQSAIVIALVIVASACSGGHGQRAAPASTTSPPVAIPPPPAAGFLGAAPGDGVHALAVWSWSGRRIATVRTKAAVQCCGVDVLSPDGTRLLLFDTQAGSKPRAEVTDIQGRLLARVAGFDAATWADDSKHLCYLRPHHPHPNFADGPADLVLVDPGHGQRVITQVPGYGSHTAPGILRCSTTDDEATVTDNVMGMNISVTSVRLSTGLATTPLWLHPPAATEVVAVSGNGRYVLEQGDTTGDVDSQIFDARTGTVVGTVTGQPLAISWNGHLVVVAASQGKVLVAVDWRTQTDRWQSAPPTGPGPTPLPAVAVSARPNSDDLALTVSEVPGHDPSSAALWLVTPSTHQLIDNDATGGGL